ncbi:MAG TPA: iron-containing redox enzyme family protein [Thermoanaerobaculia bacterium]|nr:iron-containing redox enzyme family protein [Thermoanaerobaculia bacterium]
MSSLAADPAVDLADIPASLQRLNEARLRPAVRPALSLAEEMRLRELEAEFLEHERAAILFQAATAPADPQSFLQWYENLRDTGPGQHDPLFPWLAEHATLADMRWFLAQEVAGEAGFDDLVALTQLKQPVRAKLELARNYWDEMGRGKQSGMHGPMLDRLAREVGIDLTEPVVWEALALGNLLVGLAANRHYAYHAIGALGVIELTAPGRAAHVDAALTRLGIASKTKQYYALHAVLDVKHSQTWNAEVIVPLVQADPSLARPIAEGALMRLNAGARCFARYREHLLGSSAPDRGR